MPRVLATLGASVTPFMAYSRTHNTAATGSSIAQTTLAPKDAKKERHLPRTGQSPSADGQYLVSWITTDEI